MKFIDKKQLQGLRNDAMKELYSFQKSLTMQIKHSIPSRYTSFEAFNPDYKDAASLSNLGIEVDAQNKNGETALVLACKANNTKMAKFLIYSKADVNIKDKDDLDALYYATQNNNYNIVKSLVLSDCNLETTDNYGCTPLVNAIENVNYKMIKLLIKYGANVNPESYNSALSIALKSHQYDAAKLLVDAGAKLHEAEVNEKMLFTLGRFTQMFDIDNLDFVSKDSKSKKEHTFE